MINEVRGLQATIVTNAEQDDQALRLLELMGMPFAKEEIQDEESSERKA